ncbi:MAG: hypothetical protein KDN19_08895 [Verrucomicrobiae bacterium]|nr:hypothetical protein [Verrucomicrobiae bacterium]
MFETRKKVTRWGRCGLAMTGFAVALPGVVAIAEESDIIRGKTGPWGALEMVHCQFEPPAWYLDAAGFETMPGDWHFPGFTREKVTAYLESIGMEQSQVASLFSDLPEPQPSDGVILRPSAELIRKLSREQRGRLYGDLARSDRNLMQQLPFSIDPRGFAHMAKGSGLDGDLVSEVTSMVYLKDGLPVFADLPLLLEEIPDPAGKRRLLSVLLRQEGMLVRVKIPESHEERRIMADYWSGGIRDRNSRLLALLDSLSKGEGAGVPMDLLYLPPPNARKLINTYPPQESQVGNVAPDCFWTAFNFLADEVSDRALDPGMIDRYLEDRYEPVPDEPVFGDVIVFSDPETLVPFHACVYLADRLIFTENGQSLLRPWVLMRLDDLAVSYWGDRPMAAHVFRRIREPDQP